MRFGAYLKEQQVADDASIEATRLSLREEIDAAIEAAWEAPDPVPETALRHVFAEDTGESSEERG